MKKLILATLMAGLIPMIASAQGTVSFSSSSANHKVTSNGTTGVGAGYIAALYWGAGTGPAAENTLVQLGATTGVTGGTGFLVNGGTRTTGGATAEGAQATFQVRAWTSSSGATWEEALTSGSGFAGKTAPFVNNTGGPNLSPPVTAQQLAGWTTPITVTPIPEPSTIALAGLGLASLLVIRRRK
jgi:hypothetical protein